MILTLRPVLFVVLQTLPPCVEARPSPIQQVQPIRLEEETSRPQTLRFAEADSQRSYLGGGGVGKDGTFRKKPQAETSYASRPA